MFNAQAAGLDPVGLPICVPSLKQHGVAFGVPE